MLIIAQPPDQGMEMGLGLSRRSPLPNTLNDAESLPTEELADGADACPIIRLDTITSFFSFLKKGLSSIIEWIAFRL